MSRFTLLGVGLFVLGIVLALLWLPGSGRGKLAEAHGVVDQSQTQGSSEEFNGQKPMQQSFQPAANTIVGVDVKGVAPFGDEPNMLWTVQIRRSFQFGPIIAMQSHVGLSGTETVYHIDFPSPVTVTPGQTYWLEVSGEGNHFLWVTQFTGNPYPNGAADNEFCFFAYPDADPLLQSPTAG